MAEVFTHEINSVTMQELHDGGLNPFAVQLLVESYASPKRAAALNGELKPLTFVWRGVEVSLKVYQFPAPVPSGRDPGGEG